LKAFAYLLLTNLRTFIRNKATIFWTFFFPIFFILIFGAVFSGQDNINYSVGLVMEDSSYTSQAFAAVLQNVSAFTIHSGDRAGELQAMKDGDRRAVIIVSQGFGENISHGLKGNIEVYYDPTQTSSTQVLLPVINQVVDGFDRAISRTPSLVQVNEQTLQTHKLRYIDYFVPGILAMALMQLGLSSAAVAVQMRENKIYKRLGATPLGRGTMVLSGVVFWLMVAFVQAALIIVVARLVFHVPVLGNWFALVGFVIVGILTFQCMGYMLSVFAKTQETIMPLIMAVQFPMMFLSGIFFPVNMMPGFMRPIMDAMPLTYLSDSIRQIMVQSQPLHSYLINLGVLIAWLVGCFIVAVRFFKWE
jgi:ABC-2 type transport system permease protein